MYPKINDSLFIHIATGDAAEADAEYRSRIAEVEEDSILIEVPMQEGTGRYKKLFAGDELSVYFMTEGGIKNYFYTHVLGFKEDVIRMVRVRKPEPDSIIKIQRRSYLRVQAGLELAIKDKEGRRYLMRTEDVGGGGASFRDAEGMQLEAEAILRCWLLIPFRSGVSEHASFEAEVVRMKQLDNGRHLVMLKFTAISDAERQKIIRYCFERQFDFRNR